MADAERLAFSGPSCHFTQGTSLALMRERSLGAGAAVPAAVAAAVVTGVVALGDDEVADLVLSVR